MMMRQDTRHLFSPADMAGDHDGGLEHNHHWARERNGLRQNGPIAANAAAARTPSSVTHDDAIYGAH